MRVFRGHLHAVPTPTAVAIGNFDGVHLGHAALLRQLVTTAAVRGLTPTVLTFEPHPREFFSPATAPARLSTLREKLELLAEQGVAQTMVCPFNHRFAALGAEDFVSVVLRDALRARYVVIGDDFRFGRGRDGDFALLQKMGAAAGFEVAAMGSVLRSGVRVSSSAVRAALSAGDLSLAAALLVGVFALFHGLAHGDELAGGASALPTLSGMLAATLLLHATGLALGWSLRSASVWLPRLAGAAVAVLGVAMLTS